MTTPSPNPDDVTTRLRRHAMNVGNASWPPGSIEMAIEAADLIDLLRRQLAERDAVLAELVDTLTPSEQDPIKDPAFGDKVRALGLEIGFGALMSSASYEWRAWLAENGYPLGSEFVSGPCRSVLQSDMKRARSALADREKSADDIMDQALEKHRNAAALIADAEVLEQLAYDTADYCGGGEP
jgi:hypothetical protein